MCGIAGNYSLKGETFSMHHLKKMASAIAHRGPDNEGFFIDKENHGFHPEIIFLHKKETFIPAEPGTP